MEGDLREEQSAQDKQPRALWLLAGTELGERFSFYSMRAIFMLYLLNALALAPGKAGPIMGAFMGLSYVLAIIGGYIADRFWGQQKAIIAGGIFIAVGQFIMGFHAMTSSAGNTQLSMMYFAIAIIVGGVALLKPNVTSILGPMYRTNDPRRDGGFTIFYMGINVGALIANLVVPFIAEESSQAGAKWEYGFFAAGIVMLISLVIFCVLRKKVIGEPGSKPGLRHSITKQEIVKSLIVLALAIGAIYISKMISFAGPVLIIAGIIGFTYYLFSHLDDVKEKQRILVIFILAFFVIFFWSAFEQAGTSLTIFADRQVDRMVPAFIPIIGGKDLPAGVFQSLNPFLIILLAPLFSKMWITLAKKNMDPSTPMKFVWGLALLALGFFFMVLGATAFMKTGMRVGMSFLCFSYLFQTLGELCLSPVGLSMVTKLAPSKFVSLLMGFWFVAIGSANFTAGWASGYYDKIALNKFFMIPTAMAALSALVLLVLVKPIKKWMHGIH